MSKFSHISIIKLSIISFAILMFLASDLFFSTSSLVPKISLLTNATLDPYFCKLDFIITSLGFSIMFYSLWMSNYKWINYGLSLCLISFSFDINRFNTTSYIFFIIWAMYSISHQVKINFKHSIILFFAFIYFWSGTNKINPHFYPNCYQFLMKMTPLTLPISDNRYISIIVPFIELFGGLFLLFNSFRKLGIFTLVLMHILIMIIMMYTKWDLYIIPWNIFMSLTLLSFWDESFDLKSYLAQAPTSILVFLIPICILLPLLYIFNITSGEYAFTMYSGRTTSAQIMMKESDIPLLSPSLQSKLGNYNGVPGLFLDDYTLDANNTVIHNSEFAYKKFFVKQTENYSDSTFLILSHFPILKDTIIFDTFYKH